MKNQTGSSILELTIASCLMVILITTIMAAISASSSMISKSLDLQKAKSEIVVTFSGLRKELFNATVLTPEEPLVLPKDGLYRGFAGLHSHPKCRYEVDPNDSTREKYSILRVTTFLRKTQPEELLKIWNITDTVNDMRISYHNGPSYMFQPSNIDLIKEVTVLDIDGAYRSRFLVTSAIHKPASDVDPYTLLPVPGVTFPAWTQLYLKTPNNAAGSPVPALNQNFVSHSLVYPSRTRVYCVDTNSNKIIQYDETSDVISTFFDADNYKASISRFEIRYLGTKNTDRFDPGKMFIFPMGVTDILKRRCINTFNIRLELTQNDPASSGKIYQFNQSGLLKTFNVVRPADCDL
ncbi:MAG: hypothetical protein A4S09_10730 [Proteobacteria bacterium SG_bin7]|nr:MAG: hypothetical protein A4S09_10730 [Proteobacteria bacterium SG_bin7]